MRKGAIHFGIELERSIRALLQIPVKHSIVFGGGFLVKLYCFTGHGAA